MYIPTALAKLSVAQISRLLNGHGVRVKHGDHHQVELSQEQTKKLHRAHAKGSATTLVLDPFQIAQHQHLRGGSLSYDKFANNPNVKRIASAATDRAVKAIAGSGLSYDKFANNPNVKRIASAATDRAVKAIAGSGLSYDKFANNPNVKRIASAATDRAVKGIAGSGVNRINKFKRWTGALGEAYQGIAHAVKPVAQPVFQAMSQEAVDQINPSASDIVMNRMLGVGVKKVGRRRGGYLHAA